MDLLPFGTVEQEIESRNFSPSYGDLEENPPQLFQGFSSVLLNCASVCCVLFIFLGIPGNLITIVALARCKKVRNATAVFIINLSLSDLLFCCFNLPLAASLFYHRSWIHGELMCRLFPLLRYGLLAVSLVTILNITINRYIMIGHPRIYPRIYRRKYLTVMVVLTWVFAFGSLIPTWRGNWGRFGLDHNIGSCSILPSANGSSPKEFLFLMAFVIPCCAIILCYARIFYIVRKTALKTHDIHATANGSVRLTHNKISTQARNQSNVDQRRFSQEEKKFGSPESPKSRGNGQRMKKFISKNREEDLKFIDTSVDSDLPPTLSQLQRKSVQISLEHETFSFSSPIISEAPPTTETTIISLDNAQLNTINRMANDSKQHNNQAMMGSHDDQECPDSAVDDSPTNSLDKYQQRRKISEPMTEPSSSSGIDLPDDLQNVPKGSKKYSTKKSNTRVKQRKLKDDKPPQEPRKKSLGNTSGASILYAGRMSSKDRRLLKMILVIFLSFLTCYLPITLSKVLRSIAEINFIFITSYLLVYLTTCINPMIYVVMSSEYRQAYKNLLMCRDNKGMGKLRESRRRL